MDLKKQPRPGSECYGRYHVGRAEDSESFSHAKAGFIGTASSNALTEQFLFHGKTDFDDRYQLL